MLLRTKITGLSLFTKLFLIFAVATVLITSLSFYFVNEIKFSDIKIQKMRDRNRQQYAEMLADKIGNPPNLEMAKQLSKDLDILTRIEDGNSLLYSSDNFDIDSTRLKNRWKGIQERDGLFVTESGHQMFVLVKRDRYTFIFEYHCDSFVDGRLELLFPLFALIFLILLVSFGSIRNLFSPLQRLTKGIEEITSGNIKHRVPASTHDEIGLLASTFNAMTDRIEDTLQNKDQLLLDISHELRSPLTRCKLALELPPEQYSEKIRSNLNEMDTMLDELLESARMENGAQGFQKEEFSLESLIYDLATPYFDMKPGLIIHPISEDTQIYADPSRIFKVIRNLLENAFKYSSNQEKSVEINVTRTNSTIEISVKDYGQGIPKDEQSRIFEPFYRVDKSRTKSTGGYGLGLSLCKKIVSAHNGSISISSEVGQGTTVLVSLPISS